MTRLNCFRGISFLSMGLLVIGLAGCLGSGGDDDSSSSSNNDGDRPSPDIGTGMDAGADMSSADAEEDSSVLDASLTDFTGPGEFSCDEIPVETNAGVECAEDGSNCLNGVCASFAEDDPAICGQLCVPGTCEDTCGFGELCYGLIDPATGAEQELIPGTGILAGVCGTEISGSQGAYQPCGGSFDMCESGMACLVADASSVEGMCFPECFSDTDCPTLDGFSGQCVLQTDDVATTYCAIICATSGSTDECPAGMACSPIGTGFMCGW
jgi:hypothetical protein